MLPYKYNMSFGVLRTLSQERLNWFCFSGGFWHFLFQSDLLNYFVVFMGSQSFCLLTAILYFWPMIDRATGIYEQKINNARPSDKPPMLLKRTGFLVSSGGHWSENVKPASHEWKQCKVSYTISLHERVFYIGFLCLNSVMFLKPWRGMKNPVHGKEREREGANKWKL